MSDCTNGADFVVSTGSDTLATCRAHLADAVDSKGATAPRVLVYGSPAGECQVPRKFRVGFSK